VDQPPASLRVDYDVLLGYPDGGTLALTWHADDGVPWFVQYADHWAANYVVTVNDGHVTIQQALLFLKLAGRQYPDLMTQLVEQQLIVEAIEKDPLPVSATELQAASDEFRIAIGLSSADETRRWLEEMGLSIVRFQELLRGKIQAQKLKDRVTADRIEPYFEAHREGFDLVQFFQVEAPVAAVASNLARRAREQNLITAIRTNAVRIGGKDLGAVLRSQRVCELPSVLTSAVPGEVVGPVAESGRYWVAEVFDRQPARLDAQTRAAIHEKLFREWLTDQRKQATVHWHWL
jgi:putative peptide maturation system protein